jgi:hypothetical protein
MVPATTWAGFRRRAAAFVVAVAWLAPAAAAQTKPQPVVGPDDGSCRACHAGIEEMHPWQPIGCVLCHGGNGSRPGKDEAHVRPQIGWPPDERVVPEGFDPAFVRFRDPGDLRVVATTCGSCHPDEVDRLGRSLHGTTAGHLSDGLYENGLLEKRVSRYSVFAVSASDATPASPFGLSHLEDIERLRVPHDPKTIGDHFADLPRKACMQCHLWSQGVAVPGRLGQDGLYRGAGCATCHVTYAEDGRSQSADAAADRLSPGHPLRHQLTDAPPAETCLHCHVGDASIGNGFRGLAQLYPQQPAGPEIQGTTDRLIAGQFFIRDEQLTPPDLHHAAGLDCIDCHTARDVMGDGVLYGAMEHAVEIECSSCHGSFTRPSALQTSRGRPLPQLARKNDMVILSGKRDGTSRRVKQAQDVIDPQHPDYDPRAAAAMTKEHEGLECYACHAGWNTDFFGFHFDRNLAFTQLDTITGQRTKGRVTTQERVFATLRSFTLGLNSEGQVAPFLVGFSTMGTVHGEDGALLLDQALPETAAGLSGMTMVAHQLHTTQKVARSCVECHRNPATWGLGSGDQGTSSYALARGLLLVAGERGLDTLLLDRENPEASAYLARLPLGGARRVIVDSDPVSGAASTAFVVIEHAGVALVDVRNPAFPAVMAFAAAGDARDVALAGDLLVIANGTGGVRLVDVADRRHPKLVSDLVTVEARGVCVQWPRVLVADGGGGLLIADVSQPSRPRVAGQVRLPAPGRPEAGDAYAVAAIFQSGHPLGPEQRAPGRMLAAVANGAFGLALVDVTEPAAAQPVLVAQRYEPQLSAIDISLTRRVELGDTTGQRPTRERDVAYLLYASPDGTGRVEVVDVTESTRPPTLDRVRIGDQGGPVGGGALVRSFNPPALASRYAVGGDGGLLVIDVTRSDDARLVARLGGVAGAKDVAAEAFAFDRMIDETGRQLKDISHEGSRYFTAAEVFRVLTVPGELLGTLDDGGVRREQMAEQYAGRATPGGDPANSLRGRDPAAVEEMLQRLAGGFRIAAQEDLARLVRHAWPPDFDANHDLALSRGELEELVFWVLDANGDGTLDALEWPRHPGDKPEALDKDHDGQVSRAEMDLGPEVLKFFDPDGDGKAAFVEWPFAIDLDPLPALYFAQVADLKKLIAKPGFQSQRPLLYRAIAGELAPHDVTDQHIEDVLARARGNPLDDPYGNVSAPGFVERWDLDGDHAVEPWEFPAFARVAERCDRNGDGKIDRKDRP